MNSKKQPDLNDELSVKLEDVAASIRDTAQACEGESLQLLAILRLLESLHREIRDSLFQNALPDNRQNLYSLLKDIETSGGWPYIHRMKLQALLSRIWSCSDSELISTLSETTRETNSKDIKNRS